MCRWKHENPANGYNPSEGRRDEIEPPKKRTQKVAPPCAAAGVAELSIARLQAGGGSVGRNKNIYRKPDCVVPQTMSDPSTQTSASAVQGRVGRTKQETTKPDPEARKTSKDD